MSIPLRVFLVRLTKLAQNSHPDIWSKIMFVYSNIYIQYWWVPPYPQNRLFLGLFVPSVTIVVLVATIYRSILIRKSMRVWCNEVWCWIIREWFISHPFQNSVWVPCMNAYVGRRIATCPRYASIAESASISSRIRRCWVRPWRQSQSQSQTRKRML